MILFGQKYFCPRLLPPQNGEVQLTGITIGSTATYSCVSDDFTVVGKKTRKCMSTGVWNGVEPRCVSKYNMRVAMN